MLTVIQMSKTVSLRLHKRSLSELDELAKLEDKDRSALVREILEVGVREKKIEHFLRLYQAGKVSLWKAARLAGLSLWELIEALSSKKIQIQYSERDLEKDLKALEEA